MVNVQVVEDGWIASEAKKQEEVKQKELKDRGIVVLLYGDTSSGKTYTSMTFPDPILFIDTEMRAEMTKEFCFKEKQIEVFEPMDTHDVVMKDGDVFDEHKSIENLSRKLVEACNEIKTGKKNYQTIVLDSCTELWSWIQQWMRVELARAQNKDGSRKANMIMMTVNSQLDWKIANRRHYDIVQVLRSMTKYGVNIVFTAREEPPAPEYIVKEGVTPKDKIRSQKDLPFVADVVFQLKKKENRYLALCEKIGPKRPTNTPVENLDYVKIREMLK